ncbi:MAG TPA: glycoside hydrolase, partial [Polyangiaceae bacterium]|nr:glycoside hydrolase [Polyangiaceae bacterium]
GTELQARADALISFFHSKGPKVYGSLWETDGSQGGGFHSCGLVAMNATATLATSAAVAPKAAEIVEDFWNYPLPVGQYRYYDGLLYMFGFLHLSGQYRIYAGQ